MKVAFRVDASDTIGTGHLMRCLTLADRLVGEGHDCRFIMRAHAGAPLALVEQRGFSLSALPAPAAEEPNDNDLAHSPWLGVKQARDAAETQAALNEGVDWLVVDHYGIDRRWHMLMRPKAARILAIDDIADRAFDCDLLLDQNLQAGISRYDGLVPASCELLLGPRHALLRPEFARLHEASRPVRDRLGSIFVYMGGIDADGATLLALEGLALAGLDGLPLDIIAGERNPHRARITAWCASRPQSTLHGGGTDIAAVMARADLAIGAAGATAWERCCLGLPTLLLTIADNQRPGAGALAREGAAIWLGEASSVTAEVIATALQTLMAAPTLVQSLATRAAKLVDGKGTRRVARAMLAYEIVLRKARADECDAVWRWRNDEATRRFFNDPSPVPLEEHRAWYAKALADPNRRLLVGELGGRPIGVLRFDMNGIIATASIYLVPGRVGEGQGTALLRAGVRWLAQHLEEIKIIEADVLEANQPSLGTFRAAGFVPFSTRFRRRIANKDAT